MSEALPPVDKPGTNRGQTVECTPEVRQRNWGQLFLRKRL